VCTRARAQTACEKEKKKKKKKGKKKANRRKRRYHTTGKSAAGVGRAARRMCHTAIRRRA
jgi:hypothetical protein